MLPLGFVLALPLLGTQFLGKEPHGPLARVNATQIVEPEAHACRRWGKRGQRWLALDKLGSVVGEAKVTLLDYYDYTGCDELVLRRTKGRAGAGIFVRGRYRPLALQPWSPPMSALTRFITSR